MRKSLALVVLASLALSACGTIGGRRSGAPDEFAVARNAPLVIPPDYSLTPPVAGTVTSTPADAQSQAVEALFGGPAPRPQSEMQLLDEAGRDRAAIGARSIAGDPNTNVVDKGIVTQTIIEAPSGPGREASVTTPQ